MNVQRFIPGINSEKRGVCLDVEVEQEELLGEDTKVTEVYDPEPNRADRTDDYPRMMRFRQAKIDGRGMQKGDKKFKKSSGSRSGKGNLRIDDKILTSFA